MDGLEAQVVSQSPWMAVIIFWLYRIEHRLDRLETIHDKCKE